METVDRPTPPAQDGTPVADPCPTIIAPRRSRYFSSHLNPKKHAAKKPPTLGGEVGRLAQTGHVVEHDGVEFSWSGRPKERR